MKSNRRIKIIKSERLLFLALLSFQFFSVDPLFAAKIPQPFAQNGILDLRQWNVSEKGPVPLDGEWTFVWKRFCSPHSDFSKESGHIKVPGVWRKQKNRGKYLSSEGYGTYRLKILRQNRPEIVAFKLPTAGTAYRFFVNGNEVASTGRTGTSRTSSTPAFRPQIVNYFADTPELDIVIQMSNFHFIWGGQQSVFVSMIIQAESKIALKMRMAPFIRESSMVKIA